DEVVLTSDRKTISIELKNQQSGSDLTLFEVFPNPASEIINIGAGFDLTGEYLIRIVNLYGITVSTKIWQITNPEIFQRTVLAIEHLRPGYYQLILSGPNTFHTQSLVIY
ncbi:MAG: T9SS type A sorting domain-containing protein, partial [Bacteroidetes bacterium]|nr:T9SS type A sorting domain-containing protein [Bacteroidota bacterium]